MSGPPRNEMTIFQFDECFNDRSLAEDCIAQNLAMVYRYPRRMRGKDDSDVLREFMDKSNPLVTEDLDIVRDHLEHMPDCHPGVVAINNGRGNPETITTRIIRRILSRFKSMFPDWHRADLRNTILEITPESVEPFHVENGRLIRDHYLPFDRSEWNSIAAETLARNASRARHTEERTLPDQKAEG